MRGSARGGDPNVGTGRDLSRSDREPVLLVQRGRSGGTTPQGLICLRKNRKDRVPVFFPTAQISSSSSPQPPITMRGSVAGATVRKWSAAQRGASDAAVAGMVGPNSVRPWGERPLAPRGVARASPPVSDHGRDGHSGTATFGCALHRLSACAHTLFAKNPLIVMEKPPITAKGKCGAAYEGA